MPDPTADTCQIAPPPAGPYVSRLTAEDRELYQTTTDDLDLACEIRLMRVVLANLCADIPGNHRAMSAVFSALVRAVSLQATKLRGANEDQREAEDAGERALQSLQSESK